MTITALTSLAAAQPKPRPAVVELSPYKSVIFGFVDDTAAGAGSIRKVARVRPGGRVAHVERFSS